MQTSPAAVAPRPPLKVGPTGRFVVDQDGTPVLVHDDTAWSIIVAATREHALRYLDDRAAVPIWTGGGHAGWPTMGHAAV